MFLVIGIVKKGWVFSNYKKPSKNAKYVRPSEAKDLFEVTEADPSGNILRIKVSSFDKAASTNLADKGNINSEYSGEFAVGTVLQFHLNEYTYEKKQGGAGTLPADVDVLPAYTLAQLVVAPTATPPDDKPRGYGMKMAELRPLEFSLHSYMHPTGLAHLPSTLDKSSELVYSLLSKQSSIEKLINATCAGFFGGTSGNAYIAEKDEEWMRLTCPEGPVMESLQEMDVHKVRPV